MMQKFFLVVLLCTISMHIYSSDFYYPESLEAANNAALCENVVVGICFGSLIPTVYSTLLAASQSRLPFEQKAKIVISSIATSIVVSGFAAAYIPHMLPTVNFSDDTPDHMRWHIEAGLGGAAMGTIAGSYVGYGMSKQQLKTYRV
jgi:hypothetical protein